jgi:phosphoglycerate-specific signal transduction histidine kinase
MSAADELGKLLKQLSDIHSKYIELCQKHITLIDEYNRVAQAYVELAQVHEDFKAEVHQAMQEMGAQWNQKTEGPKN